MSVADELDDEDRVLAAEYVLGLLTGDILRAFERRLAAEPAVEATVERWQNDFVALTEDIAPVDPPARVWAAISDELFGRESRPPLLARLGVMQALLAVAAVVVLGIVVWRSDLLGPELVPEYAATLAAQDASLAFQAQYDSDTGTLRLIRTAGDAAPGRSLEFWLIAGNDAPVSVMVWPTGADQEDIILPAPIAANLPGGTLAISDEPLGGSPTGAPTGAVLATGQVDEV